MLQARSKDVGAWLHMH